VKTGVGYKRYIQNYMCDGPLTDVEYRAFLNMWLCRFIFCGKANEPTLNHIVMAEDLAAGTSIPLGKYLLGSVYHMLHQTTYLMHTSQKIPCVNGPWWFVQMWLQLYMHQIVAIDLNNRHFPSTNYKEGETQSTKGCQNFHHLIFQSFSSLALIPYLLVAEETLVSQTVGSSSPHHVSTLASPRIQPSSPQPEVSASPRNNPVSPQPDIQEPSLEPEKFPSPIREARNEVSMNIHLFYFHLIDPH
jgi:succinate dehydrogenase hydrophobic anchor subunit